MRWIALLLGVALAATYTAPAIGGPDLVGKLNRIDKREARHYKELDRRIKAGVLLALGPPSIDHVESAMLPDSSGRYFSATAYCSRGRVVGGGVDWGVSTLYGDYRVIASAPTYTGWRATVYTGNAPAPLGKPSVYVLCAY